MRQIVEIKLLPKSLDDIELTLKKAAKAAKIPIEDISDWKVLKRSLDARGSHPIFRLRIEIFINEEAAPTPSILSNFSIQKASKEVLIIGAGPAGYFAALELIENGLKPIVLDRGKDVRARRRDLRAIQQFGVVNPDSNYCFGEGGAGTYSDGKLYTRSHKRGNIEKALNLLVEHGATSDILVDAHPHIGSNKLPKIVANIRSTIEQFGGEVHFDSKVTDFILKDKKVVGVVVNDEKEFFAQSVILATGHSARDIYQLLWNKKIKIEAKPFALGVRVEHPQSIIDQAQYGQKKREENLPASSYRLACQVGDRGVFSFCMCPGGLVVPAATAPGEIVVNGMSMSRRDSAYANSGTVVQIELSDINQGDEVSPFTSMNFQREVEQKLFNFGDGSQKAPAQRMTDFVNGKTSSSLPDSSYIPGLFPAPLHHLLPEFIYAKLRRGVLNFGKKMKNYFTEEANVIGTESRTSSPIRIPRNKETLMHVEIEGLFPCGEGAGYAGGIISAAMDGQNVARAVAKYYSS